MKFLIDTHYLLWAAIRSSRAEPWAKSLMGDAENQVFVSAASVYEIGIKVRAGKLPEAAELDRTMIPSVRELGYILLPITAEVMARAAHFPANHKDPFDRILAAQAIELDIPVLTTDAKLSNFGARRLTAPTLG